VIFARINLLFRYSRPASKPPSCNANVVSYCGKRQPPCVSHHSP